MLFTKGAKVKFLHTGDEGVVKGHLDNGMVNVYLTKEDMEIPAAEEDLILADSSHIKTVKVKKEIEQEKLEQKIKPVKIETQYTILKGQGTQLSFLPITNREGLTEKFLLYLINDTKSDVIYDIKLLLNYRTDSWNGKLDSTSYIELGEMIYDDLNEAPEFEVEIKWITTEGVSEADFKVLKIKAKSFFKTLKTAPLLNQPSHLYQLFNKSTSEDTKPKEDLTAYTKRHAKPTWYSGKNLDLVNQIDTSNLAHFSREIDLHIEALRDNSSKMSNAEIIAVQLEAFEDYLLKALRLGVPSFFVIHGIGKGKLRNEIATRLMKHPDVDTFKNEYHPKYGWGATEVFIVQ